MASSLLALLDDIATLLDDVAVMTKVAAKKTAGVLGDDLALNAEQVAGVAAKRELPVVWAVAKGSAVNKAILVPAALAISALMPWAILPLLMLGGAFLCFEGFEKVVHKFFHKAESVANHVAITQAVQNPEVDMVQFEKDKIKGAIRTDFILSAEIIVITLGTVASAAFARQVTVLVAISIIMTVGVYGLVAGIVKMDDAGLHLMKSASAGARSFGRGLVAFAPKLMKFLSIAGTIAMFTVGGSIIAHGIPAIEHFIKAMVGTGALSGVWGFVLEGMVGVIVGAICVALFMTVQKLRGK
jgi:predicted DNA repair protein MutK